jgi:uncharacterized protein YbaP (TraB family)
MKKILLLIAAAFLYLLQANAQSVADRSLLWRVSGKGIKTSYLFGTIHLICPGDYVWTNKMQQSLEHSDEACFEMNLSDPQVLSAIATGFVDKSGKTLKDYFSAADYIKLTAYVRDSLGADISMFQSLKPVALQTMLTSKSVGCAEPVSYEEKIMAEVQKEKKTITGLETAEEQIAVLESIPADSVIKDIIAVVNGKPDDDPEEYQRLVDAYKEQNLPELYKLIMSSKDMAAEMGTFLDDRNKKWIARMTTKMQQKPEFVAVGAGHLWGSNGVISLLRKAGYTVVPVK